MMDILPQDSAYLQGLIRKLAPPLGKWVWFDYLNMYLFLVTLLSTEPEIQYVALRNINLIVQKRWVMMDYFQSMNIDKLWMI